MIIWPLWLSKKGRVPAPCEPLPEQQTNGQQKNSWINPAGQNPTVQKQTSQCPNSLEPHASCRGCLASMLQSSPAMMCPGVWAPTQWTSPRNGGTRRSNCAHNSGHCSMPQASSSSHSSLTNHSSSSQLCCSCLGLHKTCSAPSARSQPASISHCQRDPHLLIQVQHGPPPQVPLPPLPSDH